MKDCKNKVQTPFIQISDNINTTCWFHVAVDRGQMSSSNINEQSRSEFRMNIQNYRPTIRTRKPLLILINKYNIQGSINCKKKFLS